MAKFMDFVTGEVIEMKVLGGRTIGKQVNLARAFMGYCEDKGGVNLWTFGTRFLKLAEITGVAQNFGRRLNKRGLDYIMVLEAGEEGKRWHIHMLLPGYLDWYMMKDEWEAVVGEEGLHVQFRKVQTGDKVAWYVAKYLRKDFGEGCFGVRRFRSSKNLTKKVADFYPKHEQRVIWMQCKDLETENFDCDGRRKEDGSITDSIIRSGPREEIEKGVQPNSINGN